MGLGVFNITIICHHGLEEQALGLNMTVDNRLVAYDNGIDGDCRAYTNITCGRTAVSLAG